MPSRSHMAAQTVNGQLGLQSASSDASGKCVDILSQTTSSPSQIQLWDCGGWSSQNFVLNSDGTIRAYAGDNAADAGGPLCLDIWGGVAADDTAISLYGCNGSINQQWKYDSNTQELHGQGDLSNFCLDYDTRNTNGSVQNGTRLHLWTCYGSPSQKWQISGASSPTSPTTGAFNVQVLPMKARYSPGEDPGFTVNVTNPSSNSVSGVIMLRQTSAVKPGFSHTDYRQTTIGANSAQGEDMYWFCSGGDTSCRPGDDFTGYFVEATFTPDGSTSSQGYGSSAIDISSTWVHYPRYGYISEFFDGQTGGRDQQIIDTLTREFHINGMQYYDWQYRHDTPITPNGDSTWTDWRESLTISKAVLQDLIQKGHDRGAAAMPYMTMYAGLVNYQDHGVSQSWGLFSSSGEQFNFINKFFAFNPMNVDWQNFMLPQYSRTLSFLNWDGVHLDTYGTMGDGNYFDANGNKIDYSTTFVSPMLNRI